MKVQAATVVHPTLTTVAPLMNMMQPTPMGQSPMPYNPVTVVLTSHTKTITPTHMINLNGWTKTSLIQLKTI